MPAGIARSRQATSGARGHQLVEHQPGAHPAGIDLERAQLAARTMVDHALLRFEDFDILHEDGALLARDRIEAFFRVYKALSEEGNPVRLDGYGDAEEAKSLISGALERFTGRAEARK